jgi:hypothetical protein
MPGLGGCFFSTNQPSAIAKGKQEQRSNPKFPNSPARLDAAEK